MKDLPPSGGTGLRDIIVAIRELIRGRSNSVLTVTLTPSATSTTVTGPNLNENALPFLSPLTANAAAAMATTYASISRVSGTVTVTITHANSASTDRTFALDVRGG